MPTTLLCRRIARKLWLCVPSRVIDTSSVLKALPDCNNSILTPDFTGWDAQSRVQAIGSVHGVLLFRRIPMRSNPQSAPWPLILAIVAVTIVTGTRAVAHEKILHAFGSKSSDGIAPYFGLVFDSAGNLYGTTADGGAYSGGIIFELSPAETRGWFERSLFNFQWAASGSEPLTALILYPAGNLYGTTESGGANKLGTMFELKRSSGCGWVEKVAYSFGNSNGAGSILPLASLTVDAAGNLYGTALGGSHNLGTVFKLSRATRGAWKETVLHNFGKGGRRFLPVGRPTHGRCR
jgi:uncharacterized repeat protein (TIGR03803 family)